MNNREIVVSDKENIKVIHDIYMPEGWIVVPTKNGWHVINGDAYIFMSLEQVERIWNKNVEKWLENYLIK